MAPNNLRIHMLITSFNDPYWSQVLEGTYQAAQSLGVELAVTHEDLPYEPTHAQEEALLEEILGLNAKVLLHAGLSKTVVQGLLAAGISLVYLSETDLEHPQVYAPVGLYAAAWAAGKFLADQTPSPSRVLVIGGWEGSLRAEVGQSRIRGFMDAMKLLPNAQIDHIACGWSYTEALEAVSLQTDKKPNRYQAVFGLSDTLAMAGRDALEQKGLLDPNTQVVGVNGDPFALAAVASGKMSATVEAAAIALGRDAMEIALGILNGEDLPRQFPYHLRLVTAQNVHQAAAEKLFAIAELPGRLMSLEQRFFNERFIQLGTSLEINRKVGSILNLQQLTTEISNLIRSTYGYATVQLYRWNSATHSVDLESPDRLHQQVDLNDEHSPLAKVINTGTLLFISNAQADNFLSQNLQPFTQSRLLLPIHFSNNLTHLMDLQSDRPIFHTRQELIALQLLADQFGVAIRNAELYKELSISHEEALRSQAQAEKADALKTRLLANVSHELRTPLNIITGYSQSALSSPSPYGITLPDRLRDDLTHIQESGDHLIRLINDLLDLSRAEIDALDLFIEVSSPRKLIEESFYSIAGAPGNPPNVQWQLDLPEYIPTLHADPLRLRQILLNLLSNARKFTTTGSICLSVEVALPHLHISIKDTGAGISIEAQEQIFEPFVTINQAGHRHEGIGLGLSITRRLVALHKGSISLESQPGKGSTFHIYLPIPTLNADALPAKFRNDGEPVALLLTSPENPSPLLLDLCENQQLRPLYITSPQSLENLNTSLSPRVIAWDLRNALPGDWSLIQSLRLQPNLCQLPFLLLNSEQFAQTKQENLTNVLLKPVVGDTLVQFIQSMHPDQNGGAILIVDDDPKARELYRSLLSQALPNFPLISLNGGLAALDYLSKELPSLILLDLMMPDADGFEVIDFARSNPRTKNVPILVMSGHLLSYEDIKRLDHDKVVVQPKNLFTPEELSTRFGDVLAGATDLPRPTSELVKRALVFIQQNYERNFTLQELAHSVGGSKNYLSQIFRDEMGLALWDFLNRFRALQASDLLLNTNLPITAISLRVGFEDFSYFGRVFNKYYGCSPRAFRQRSAA